MGTEVPGKTIIAGRYLVRRVLGIGGMKSIKRLQGWGQALKNQPEPDPAELREI